MGVELLSAEVLLPAEVLLLSLLLCSTAEVEAAAVSVEGFGEVVLCGVGAVLSPIGSLLALALPDFRLLLIASEDRCCCRCGEAVTEAAAADERVIRVVAVAGVGVAGFLTKPTAHPTPPLSEELRAEGEAVLVSFSFGLSGSAVSAGAIVLMLIRWPAAAAFGSFDS